MDMNSYAPIVLFVYNRLGHTKQTVDALKQNPESKDSVLFIFSDGPKANAKQEDIKKIGLLREYINTISGFKQVIIEESPKNKGLAKSTIDGISKVINKYGRVIVLEDDDAPSPFFLAYENECLEKFKDDERYWLVSAYINNKNITPLEGKDVFAVYRNSSWGFGTWARCWNKVIWDINAIKKIFSYKVMLRFAKQGGYDLPIMMIDRMYGYNNSWSIRFEFSRFLHDGLTIFPTYSLIKNIGLDGSGTHCGVHDETVTYMDHKIVVPNDIPFNAEKNKQFRDSFTPRNLSGCLFNIGIYFNRNAFLKRLGIYKAIKRIYQR